MNEETQNPSQTEAGQRRLYRSINNRHVAGVCGGMAEYFNLDPVLVRVIWFFSIFVHGVGIFAYIAAWIIVPENRTGAALTAAAPRAQANAQYLLGAFLVLLGVMFLADRLDWDFLVPWHWNRFVPYWFNWGMIFSVVIILLGIMLIFRPGQSSTSAQAPTAMASSETPETGGPSPRPEIRTNEKRLIRSVEDRKIGGVCGGLAKYLNVDPALVRIGWVVMTILSQYVIGVVTYIVMMIVVPEENTVTKNPLTPVSTV
ncbi:MAG: hypothetical protein ALAOOOJD_02312 [bacterium]|nr:hypothetical protein [bacterium]